ncbi:hypothetical protein SVIOM342S_03704 [Streptomyces violaceorubidus]
MVLQTQVFAHALDWYLDTLGMIVSDFHFLDGQRERGPVMAFIRCDQGGVAVDHHTLAMHLGPGTGYVHSAYQVTDLDAIAAGGEYLAERGYQRSWGIGRHIQGSQLDYWRDPNSFMLEHFADGDLFSCDVEPGWSPMCRPRPRAMGATGHPRLPRRASVSRQGPRGAACPARRQRTRPGPAPGPAESDELMSTNVLRTADGWWVVRDTRAVRIDTEAVTTAGLLTDRDAVREAAASSATGTPVADLVALFPVTTPCRVVAQMVNYRSHARDSGFAGEIPPTFFRKASGSVSGPHAAVVRPSHVRFLDYEIELGLVMGSPLPVGTVVEERDLPSYVAGLVITNDVSARDVRA